MGVTWRSLDFTAQFHIDARFVKKFKSLETNPQKRKLWIKLFKRLSLCDNSPRTPFALSKGAPNQTKRNFKRLLLQPPLASRSWASLDSLSNSSTSLSTTSSWDRRFLFYFLTANSPRGQFSGE